MAETGLTLGSEHLVLIKASEFQASRLTYTWASVSFYIKRKRSIDLC